MMTQASRPTHGSGQSDSGLSTGKHGYYFSRSDSLLHPYIIPNPYPFAQP